MTTQKDVSFAADRRENQIIMGIAERAWNQLQLARRNDPFTKLDIAMDVTAVPVIAEGERYRWNVTRFGSKAKAFTAARGLGRVLPDIFVEDLTVPALHAVITEAAFEARGAEAAARPAERPCLAAVSGAGQAEITRAAPVRAADGEALRDDLRNSIIARS